MFADERMMWSEERFTFGGKERDAETGLHYFTFSDFTHARHSLQAVSIFLGSNTLIYLYWVKCKNMTTFISYTLHLAFRYDRILQKNRNKTRVILFCSYLC